MMLFPFKTPLVLQNLFPSMVWRKDREEIHLTFDDGPHPDITPWVVELLKKNNIKATFFCVGENALKYPEVIRLLEENGHSLGNHTQHHLNGWNTPIKTYLDDVKECQKTIPTKLFRPPYGRIKKKQRLAIEKEFTIIQWSLLSGDFDPKLKTKKALKVLTSKTKNGDIIVFHDSAKAEKNLKFLLPKYIDHCLKKGHKFAAL